MLGRQPWKAVPLVQRRHPVSGPCPVTRMLRSATMARISPSVHCRRLPSIGTRCPSHALYYVLLGNHKYSGNHASNFYMNNSLRHEGKDGNGSR